MQSTTPAVPCQQKSPGKHSARRAYQRSWSHKLACMERQTGEEGKIRLKRDPVIRSILILTVVNLTAQLTGLLSRIGISRLAGAEVTRIFSEFASKLL